MKLLLDTHIWIWSLADHPSLGRRLRALLAGTEHELWISVVSIWEVILLRGKGRLLPVGDLRAWVERAIAASQVHEAALTREIALAAHELPWVHRDPADRFLVATAQVLGLTLATADEEILALPGVALLPNR